MRKFKFRAYIQNGEWTEYGESQEYTMCYDLAFEAYEPINDLLNRTVNLEEYIGLNDIKGEELYVGDMVRNKIIKGEIKYNEEKFSFVIYDKNCDWMFISKAIENEGLERIGNIHENPELLKGVKK